MSCVYDAFMDLVMCQSCASATFSVCALSLFKPPSQLKPPSHLQGRRDHVSRGRHGITEATLARECSYEDSNCQDQPSQPEPQISAPQFRPNMDMLSDLFHRYRPLIQNSNVAGVKHTDRLHMSSLYTLLCLFYSCMYIRAQKDVQCRVLHTVGVWSIWWNIADV